MSHLVGTNKVQTNETSVCESPDLGRLMHVLTSQYKIQWQEYTHTHTLLRKRAPSKEKGGKNQLSCLSLQLPDCFSSLSDRCGIKNWFQSLLKIERWYKIYFWVILPTFLCKWSQVHHIFLPAKCKSDLVAGSIKKCIWVPAALNSKTCCPL